MIGTTRGAKCLLVVVACLMVAACAASRPNFVLILADDMGYNDFGSCGATSILTPNLDYMARTGMQMGAMYAQPICTPARGSFLTGRLPIRSGLYTNLSYPFDLFWRVFYPSSVGCLPDTEITIADALKPAGYYSGLIGKWHLGHNPKGSGGGCLPHHRGFDYFYGLPYSHEEGYPGPAPENLIWPPMPVMEGRADGSPDKILQQPMNLSTITDQYNDKIVNFLEEQASKDQPFLLHVAYEQPHVPLFASPRFLNTSLRGLYGDAVQEMDASVGLIFDTLKRLGLDDNTMVVFASDNGAWIDPSSGVPGAPGNPDLGGSNAPFRGGKGSTWEGGMRGAALFRWPGKIPEATRFLHPVTFMDLMPTLLSMAGAPPLPKDVAIDGRDISKVLFGGQASSPHEFIWYWREHTLYAVRWGSWKAHFFTRKGFGDDPPHAHDPPLLFNVDHDAAERAPVNTTTEPGKSIAAYLKQVGMQHQNNMVKGVSQYEAQDWTLVPCCHGPFNSTREKEYIAKHEWSLALWNRFGCVCP